ncbi:MAG: hypothetical protein Q7U02_14790 [Desulfosalsimonadaceae bacterium]|nr:hypothetical protein [Desulfosalsimonadaceae bacterium]
MATLIRKNTGVEFREFRDGHALMRFWGSSGLMAVRELGMTGTEVTLKLGLGFFDGLRFATPLYELTGCNQIQKQRVLHQD